MHTHTTNTWKDSGVTNEPLTVCCFFSVVRAHTHTHTHGKISGVTNYFHLLLSFWCAYMHAHTCMHTHTHTHTQSTPQNIHTAKKHMTATPAVGNVLAQTEPGLAHTVDGYVDLR